MGRGKVKYRDVVGGDKKKNSKKQNSKKFRPRKTYSLYQNNNKKSETNQKFDYVNKNSKRQTVTEEPQIEVPLESSSSEEEEIEDHMKQLRQSFASKLVEKQSVAIDSSDDSEEEQLQEEEMEVEEFVQEEQETHDVKEEEEEEEIEPASDNFEEVADDSRDPFLKHVLYDLHENLLNSLQYNPPKVDNTVLEWPILGRLLIQIPQYKDSEPNLKENTFSIAEEKSFASPGQIPERINEGKLTLEDLFIKSQISCNLKKANESINVQDNIFTSLQRELFSVINNYQDLYYCERTFSNAEEIRFIYCLHTVNHILKTRLKVIHHNTRLTKKDDVPEEFRDQGLVRPKILIIVPFKDSAYKIIQMLINILLPDDKGHVMNKKRFIEEYTGNEIIMPKKNPKPEDYELTFSGNTSDDFKIGITVTKKSLKLFADFYSSDIIVASPLGLRRIIGAEGEPERDYDFLASIELLILDQTELFITQNWDHVLHIFNHLHLQPKDSHGTDFSRIRTWSLNGWAKYYRQTLIFSSFALPEINSIFNKKCCNYAGKVKVSNVIEFGTISQIVVQIPHVFHKFEAENAQQAIDARFDFFINKILPQQMDSLMKQTLIYVSNYFDYVRLRNYFKREDTSFVQICEYSKEAKIARARDMFYHGDTHFLLYTERYHFFNRIRVKGIRHLVFYQPPNFPHFYSEMSNLMQEANMNKKIGSMSNMTVNVLYSKYDVHQIAAIVGTTRATKMIQSERNVHMMVTGGD